MLAEHQKVRGPCQRQIKLVPFDLPVGTPPQQSQANKVTLLPAAASIATFSAQKK
jgi:hypothetical protein